MERDNYKQLYNQSLSSPEVARWAVQTGRLSLNFLIKEYPRVYSREIIRYSLGLFDFIGPKELRSHFVYRGGSFFKLREIPEVDWSLDELQKAINHFGQFRAIMWLALPSIDGVLATPRNIIDQYSHIYDHVVDISSPELCYDEWLDAPVVTKPTWKLTFVHPEKFDQFDIDRLIYGGGHNQSFTFSQSDAGTELMISLIMMHLYGRGYRNRVNFDTATCGLRGIITLNFDGSIHIGFDDEKAKTINVSVEFH